MLAKIGILTKKEYKSKTILVVDDEKRLASLVEQYLTQEGYRVTTAYDGKEALEVARREHPDLIILDVMMPEMDGYEFMRVHRAEQNTPIILLNARKQMTADIAHELRTPLSLILGHAEAVHDGVLPPTRENFEIIREETARLEHLVDDLRTLSLADAGELSIQTQAISPARLLEEVANLYRYQTQTKDFNLDLDIPASLPDIEVNPGRITQVLTNILDNAVRHTPAGGRITLAASRTRDGVALSVHDSGPGLPLADLERIFDRFYRADESRTRADGGSGLSLAIAKSIVNTHGGQIRAESEQGKGLVLIITLPVKQ